MADKDKREVWLRGPLEGIHPILQPIAHALLQAREEVNEMMEGFPDEFLVIKPMGVASVGFHLQHLTGVLDRLFTYATGVLLTQKQLHALASEGKLSAKDYNLNVLLAEFSQQIDQAIRQLMETDAATLTEIRGVGRAQIPSTVIGLYVHAAEHTMRHVGQLLVTVRILKG
jgi:uncharacterized damage-inducible protein DinB